MLYFICMHKQRLFVCFNSYLSPFLWPWFPSCSPPSFALHRQSIWWKMGSHIEIWCSLRLNIHPENTKCEAPFPVCLCSEENYSSWVCSREWHVAAVSLERMDFSQIFKHLAEGLIGLVCWNKLFDQPWLLSRLHKDTVLLIQERYPNSSISRLTLMQEKKRAVGCMDITRHNNAWITRRWRYFTFFSSLLIQCNAQGDASIQWTAELIDFLNNFSLKHHVYRSLKKLDATQVSLVQLCWTMKWNIIWWFRSQNNNNKKLGSNCTHKKKGKKGEKNEMIVQCAIGGQ